MMSHVRVKAEGVWVQLPGREVRGRVAFVFVRAFDGVRAASGGGKFEG